MNWTRQQKRAIRSPCFEAIETAANQFGWLALDLRVQLRLTMNIGLE
jgi:hypothetical protein